MDYKKQYVANASRYDEGMMNYRTCGRSGIRLPEVSLGFWWNFGGVNVYEDSPAAEAGVQINDCIIRIGTGADAVSVGTVGYEKALRLLRVSIKRQQQPNRHALAVASYHCRIILKQGFEHS